MLIPSLVRRLAVLMFVILAPGSASLAQAPRLDDTPDFKGLRERWEPLLAEFEVPGMAVAIVKNGKIHAIETFGVRSPDSADPPTANTMYYIASITKTYLATAICALADEGKLSLDDLVKKHLPRFKLADEAATNSITIRDLLCHRPGINGGPIVLLDAYTGEITEDRYYKWLGALAPSEKLQYSNIHFTLLGRVIEAVTGKNWRDYLDERLFKPAELTRTSGYASRMYADPDHATPMEKRDGAWRACTLRKTDRTMHAAGGLGTSITDAARWIVLHVNDGEIDGKRVLSADSVRAMRMLTGSLPRPNGSIRVMQGFGLGWQVGNFHGVLLCSHGGGYVGTQTYYAMLPDQKCGFAILMNAGGAAAGLMDVLAVDILDRLLAGDEKIDVLDAYRKELAPRLKRRQEELAEQAAAASAPLMLTRPVAAYVGRFSNPDLGTITVGQAGERLSVSMGECRVEYAALENDRIRVLGPALEGLVIAFNVAANGEVNSATAITPDIGEFTFTR